MGSTDDETLVLAPDQGAGRDRSDRSTLATDNVVPLDDGGDADGIRVFFMLLIDANHATVGTNEHFCATSDFGRQGKSEIDFGAWSEVLLHGEVNPARGDIPSLPAMRAGFLINRQANIDRQRQVVPACHATLRHPHYSSRTGLKGDYPEKRDAIPLPKPAERLRPIATRRVLRLIDPKNERHSPRRASKPLLTSRAMVGVKNPERAVPQVFRASSVEPAFARNTIPIDVSNKVQQ